MIFQDPEGFLVATGENPDYEAKVLSLCKQWDEGQTEFVIQTSGSTGQPKAIRISRNQIEASIQMTQQALDLQPYDMAFCCLSVETIGGLMMLLRARYLGMELWVVEPKRLPFLNMDRYRSLFFSSGSSVLYAFVPTQLEALRADPASYPFLRRAKAILLGGAPISPSLKEWILEQDLPIFATYGMTETVSHIALQQIAPTLEPGFRPLPGVQVREGAEGNIEILSPTSGPNWLSTRDQVQWLEDPYFTIVGRLDSVINSGGVKIQLHTIDQAIGEWVNTNHWSGAYFAWGIPDDSWGQKLVVFFEGEELPGDIDLFWEQAHSSLLPHWKPKEFILLPHFQYTSSQKIDKLNTFHGYFTH